MEEIERGEFSGKKNQREREERKRGREEEEEGCLPYPGALRPPGGRRALFGHWQADKWLFGLPAADGSLFGPPEADGVLKLKFFNLHICFSNFVQILAHF